MPKQKKNSKEPRKEEKEKDRDDSELEEMIEESSEEEETEEKKPQENLEIIRGIDDTGFMQLLQTHSSPSLEAIPLQDQSLENVAFVSRSRNVEGKEYDDMGYDDNPYSEGGDKYTKKTPDYSGGGESDRKKESKSEE